MFQKAALKDLKLPSCFHIFQLMISPGLKKVSRFWVLAETSSTSFKASRHHGMQDFDAVVGLLTLDVLNCPALQSVEGGWRCPFSVFHFGEPRDFSGRSVLASSVATIAEAQHQRGKCWKSSENPEEITRKSLEAEVDVTATKVDLWCGRRLGDALDRCFGSKSGL